MSNKKVVDEQNIGNIILRTHEDYTYGLDLYINGEIEKYVPKEDAEEYNKAANILLKTLGDAIYHMAQAAEDEDSEEI